MVFSPSYRIKTQKTEENNTVIIFEQDVNIWTENGCKIENNSVVWLINDNNYEEVTVKVNNEEKIVYFEGNLNYNPTSLINIGIIPEEGTKPLIMGINSGDTKTGNEYLRPQGLTIAEYGNKSPKLFLGNLSKLSTDYNGYGLYADNVYLNGSLTTQVGKNSYAGVNTLTGVEASIFEEDTSKIVFWAGANSKNDPDI
jgi:hypothetical protein